MRHLIKSTAVLSIVSFFALSGLSAECARCVQIEQARANQQAHDPNANKTEYYDDYLKSHPEMQNSQNQNQTQNQQSPRG